MAWHMGGNWSTAGGQDLPHIIAQLWTAINQRHRVLLKVDDPTLSEGDIEAALSPLPGTSEVWPVATDLEGVPIHTPTYIGAIQSGIQGLLSYGGGNRWLAPTTSEYKQYVANTITPVSVWPGCNLKWLGDDVAASSAFWFGDSMPFIFFRPGWDMCRQALDRLTHVRVEFRGGYDTGFGGSPYADWTDDDDKTHKYRFGFTYPLLLNESYSTVNTLRRDMNIFIGSQSSVSEQRDECELGSYGYVRGNNNSSLATALTAFPFSEFKVVQSYVQVNQFGNHVGYPDAGEAEALLDMMEAKIGSATFKRGDLCEVPDPDNELYFQNKKFVATGLNTGQSLHNLVVEPRLDWVTVPAAGDVDDDPVLNWSINNIFGAGYLPLGEDNVSYTGQLRVIQIKTNISSELDDQT